jgi:transposase
MGLHRNARLGLAGRRQLVADVEAGLSCREAARRRSVSPTTACKWWRRWAEADVEQRLTLACLEDRSSRPRRSPRLLPEAEQARIRAARRRSGWGPRLIAGETGHPHATVWRTLRRAGSHGPFASHASARSATSGRAPATSCTSTASALSASADPARRSPATATATAPRNGCKSATSGCTHSSTTTPAPPPASSTVLHPTASPADQRQGRALPANPETRVGSRPDLPLLGPPRPGPVTLAPLLQRTQTARFAWRPATDQPRPQRPEAGHLGRGTTWTPSFRTSR